MKQYLRLNQKQTLKLKLSPSLIQRFFCLQSSSFELNDYIEKFVNENPLCELDYSEIKSSSNIQNNIDLASFAFSSDEALCLDDYLKKQLSLLDCSIKKKEIIIALIDKLNSKGFFEDYPSVESEICRRFHVSKKIVHEQLLILQDFDPDGIAARSLQESLTIQIEHYEFSDEDLKNYLLELVKNHFLLIGKNQLNKIAKAMSLSQDAVKAMLNFIKENLTPNPASRFSQVSPSYIAPSYKVYYDFDQKKLIYEDKEKQLTPKLRLSSNFQKLLDESKYDRDSFVFLSKQLEDAKQLISSLENRQQLLSRIIKSIASVQEESFKKGLHYLKPLFQRELAEKLNVSRSAVSRILSQKFIETPFGILSLKQFCPRRYFGRSKENFLKILQNCLEENPNASDANISAILRRYEIDIARRTVAKYRKELSISARFKPVNRK